MELELKAKVIKGAGLGKKYGFPTINLKPLVNTEHTPPGIYICAIFINKQKYNGVMHCGPKSIGSNDINKIYFEVHIFDFNQNIYGKNVIIHLLKKIREVRKFKDVNALIRQIKNDIKFTKKYFNA
ncbi:riboflavin kinase [Candidatus Peregrinibacteria bacterium]|nr:riboflavin kinase [Candidatus Peregrinibacteria bacterium]